MEITNGSEFDTVQAWFDAQPSQQEIDAQRQATLSKWDEQGFQPTERGLEADKYIASRNPRDNPDEFTFLGSMGYVYTGPAAFYTSHSEHTAWLNSKMSGSPYESGYDVARMVDNNSSIPKGYGLFAPLDSYEPPSRPPPMGQQPQSPRPPMGQQPSNIPPMGQQVQAVDNRPIWSALNPMGGMLTATSPMGSPRGIQRRHLINGMLRNG